MRFGDERADSPGPPTPRPYVPEHGGPDPLAGDTWGDDEVYQGRRRAAVLSNRRWIPVVAVLAGLALAITVPILLSSSTPPARPGGAGATLTGPGAGPIVVDGTSSDAVTSTEAPTSEATSTAGTSSGGAKTNTTRPRTTTPPPTTTKPPTTPAFGPVTYQAEASGNTLAGSAWVADYAGASGGKIVRNIGDWGDTPDGSLRFNGVTVPVTGSYQLTLYVVHIDNDASRTARISINGGASKAVVVDGSSTCCETKTITVTLAQGTNTITIANPSGEAPSIDRIVLRGA